MLSSRWACFISRAHPRWAAGYTKVCRDLVAAGAPLRARDENGADPLLLAAQTKMADALQLMQEEAVRKHPRPSAPSTTAGAAARPAGHGHDVLTVGRITIPHPPARLRGGCGVVTVHGQWAGQPASIRRIPLALLPNSLEALDRLVSLPDYQSHVQRYFGYEKDGDALYVAAERLDTITLRQWLAPRNTQAPSMGERHRVLHELFQGLAFLHSHNIAHGCLSPEAVGIVQGTGAVKLLFPAVARPLHGPGGSFDLAPPEGLHAIPLYVAPEEITSTPLGNTSIIEPGGVGAADLFVAGVLILQTLSSRPEAHPLAGATIAETVINVLHVNAEAAQNALWNGESRGAGGSWCAEARQLSSLLIRQQPAQRPSADTVLEHLLFWPSIRRVEYLAAALREPADSLRQQIFVKYAGDLLTIPKGAAQRANGKGPAKAAVPKGWLSRLDPPLLAIANASRYNGESARDLIRFILEVRERLANKKPSAELGTALRRAWAAVYDAVSGPVSKSRALDLEVGWARWVATDPSRADDALLAYFSDAAQCTALFIGLTLAEDEASAPTEAGAAEPAKSAA